MPIAFRARMAAAGAAGGGGWWDNNGTISGCVGAWQAKGAASLAASYTDLSGTGNDLTVGVAPTWATGTGWTFNGSTQYLIIPYQQASTNFTAIVRFSNVTGSGNRSPFGWYNQTAGAMLVQIEASQVVTYNGLNYPTGSTANPPTMTSGTYAIAGKKPYRNGSAESTTIAAGSITSPPATMYIGAIRHTFGTQQYFPGNIEAIAIYNTTLSEPNVATISTAMAAL